MSHARDITRLPVEGAGIIPFDTAASYGAGSIGEFLANLGSASWSLKSAVAPAIAAFLATTTATTATTAAIPNAAQRDLYVPSRTYNAGANATIAATGAGQVVQGNGTGSVLQTTSLKWKDFDFDYGGAHNLYLSGTSDYGISLESAGGGETLRYAKFVNLLIRGKGKAININAASQLDVASVQFSNIDAIGNTEGIYAIGGANLDLVNVQSVANQRNAYLYGVGEVKIVNGRFQGATAGPNFEMYADAARRSLESYCRTAISTRDRRPIMSRSPTSSPMQAAPKSK